MTRHAPRSTDDPNVRVGGGVGGAHTTRTRDAALYRLARANRWLLAASAAVTGVFTAVAANAFPGKATKTAAPGVAHRSAAVPKGAGESPGTSTSPSSVQPPAQAPQSSTTQEAAPSGEGSSATPEHEAAPSQEAAPSGEASSAAPEREAAPSGEASSAAPEQEAAPAQEAPPVVSGGS